MSSVSSRNGNKIKHVKLNEGLSDFVKDFDSWAEIAKTDPEKFEAHRQKMLDDFFELIPESRQQRMRGLQFQVDMECQRAKTPLAACIKISTMMWDNISKENGLMDAFKALTQGTELGKKCSEKAQLITFSREKVS